MDPFYLNGQAIALVPMNDYNSTEKALYPYA